MPSVMVILANGAEDIELVVPIDILRRAGVDVTVAGLEGSEVVTCSNKMRIQPDECLSSAKNKQYDVIMLPGGPGGTKALVGSCEVGQLIKAQEKAGKKVAAICAAPTALKAHKVFLGKKLTSYPAVKDDLTKDYKYVEEGVVVDGNLITSRGPGTAHLFGLKLVEILMGEEKAKSVASATLYNSCG